MNIRLFKSILKTSFASFVHKVFYTINPGYKYVSNWHIDLICEHLEAVKNGEIHKLIINIPPRSLKSICVSVAWPAWLLGSDPTKRILVASYSDMLSVKHSLDCRFVLQERWYNDLFPTTVLSKTHNKKNKFMTDSHGFRFATSVGGSVTGEGGDILIIDDPHNPSNIHSTLLRNKAINWYENTFATRLNNRTNGAIVIVMQRLHELDLCGYIMQKSSDWTILNIPLVGIQDESIRYRNFSYDRKIGEILHNGFSQHTIDSLINEIGVKNFAAQYQQAPIRECSTLINVDKIAFCDVDKIIDADFIVQSWDTAFKTAYNSDYSVCTTWKILGDKLYLVDLIKKKLVFSDLKNIAIELSNKYNPHYILVEDKGSGQSLIQELSALKMVNVIPIKPKMDKLSRFMSVVHILESRNVFIPRNKTWSTELIYDLSHFPNIKHDDVIDSITQAISFIHKQSRKIQTVNIRRL